MIDGVTLFEAGLYVGLHTGLDAEAFANSMRKRTAA